jgi:Bacterial dnaA protein helix-turn-helix
MNNGAINERELLCRYASVRARLMGPHQRRPRKPAPATPELLSKGGLEVSPQFNPEPIEASPEPEPEAECVSNDNDEHGPSFEASFGEGVSFPASTSIEERAAAVVALTPLIGHDRFRHLIHITARAFGVSAGDIVGTSRLNKYVVPRQIAMTIAALGFRTSLPRVGRAFGGRDHTTVLHARNKYGALIAKLIEASAPSPLSRGPGLASGPGRIDHDL